MGHVLHGCYDDDISEIIIMIKLPFIEDFHLCVSVFICVLSFNLFNSLMK